jgi:hypothetical protein
MWISKAYGPDIAKHILYEVSKKAKMLFFDTAQGGTDKADSYHLRGEKEVEKLLRENTIYKYIINLGLSEPTYHQRNMFLCTNYSKFQLSFLNKYKFFKDILD